LKATHIQFMLDRFQSHPEDDAIIWSDQRFSYGWLVNAVQDWMRQLDEQQVPRGASVSLEADFSPNAIALLLALIPMRSRCCWH